MSLIQAVGAAVGAGILFAFKRPETKGKKAALLIFIMGFVSLPFGLGYLAHCPGPQVVGVNIRLDPMAL